MSSVPTGPFTDARGSALITGSTPGASTSTQWLFDPCAFIDSDGQPYLYFADISDQRAVILLKTNMTSVSGSATPLFATNFFEASYMHKRGSTYYFTYSTRPEAGMVIYCETNSNPTNGFVPQGTVLPNPPVNVYNNITTRSSPTWEIGTSPITTATWRSKTDCRTPTRFTNAASASIR